MTFILTYVLPFLHSHFCTSVSTLQCFPLARYMQLNNGMVTKQICGADKFQIVILMTFVHVAYHFSGKHAFAEF